MSQEASRMINEYLLTVDIGRGEKVSSHSQSQEIGDDNSSYHSGIVSRQQLESDDPSDLSQISQALSSSAEDVSGVWNNNEESSSFFDEESLRWNGGTGKGRSGKYLDSQNCDGGGEDQSLQQQLIHILCMIEEPLNNLNKKYFELSQLLAQLDKVSPRPTALTLSPANAATGAISPASTVAPSTADLQSMTEAVQKEITERKHAIKTSLKKGLKLVNKLKSSNYLNDFSSLSSASDASNGNGNGSNSNYLLLSEFIPMVQTRVTDSLLSSNISQVDLKKKICWEFHGLANLKNSPSSAGKSVGSNSVQWEISNDFVEIIIEYLFFLVILSLQKWKYVKIRLDILPTSTGNSEKPKASPTSVSISSARPPSSGSSASIILNSLSLTISGSRKLSFLNSSIYKKNDLTELLSICDNLIDSSIVLLQGKFQRSGSSSSGSSSGSSASNSRHEEKKLILPIKMRKSYYFYNTSQAHPHHSFSSSSLTAASLMIPNHRYRNKQQPATVKEEGSDNSGSNDNVEEEKENKRISRAIMSFFLPVSPPPSHSSTSSTVQPPLVTPTTSTPASGNEDGTGNKKIRFSLGRKTSSVGVTLPLAHSSSTDETHSTSCSQTSVVSNGVAASRGGVPLSSFSSVSFSSTSIPYTVDGNSPPTALNSKESSVSANQAGMQRKDAVCQLLSEEEKASVEDLHRQLSSSLRHSKKLQAVTSSASASYNAEISLFISQTQSEKQTSSTMAAVKSRPVSYKRSSASASSAEQKPSASSSSSGAAFSSTKGLQHASGIFHHLYRAFFGGNNGNGNHGNHGNGNNVSGKSSDKSSSGASSHCGANSNEHLDMLATTTTAAVKTNHKVKKIKMNKTQKVEVRRRNEEEISL
jgi:hypothetical protein